MAKMLSGCYIARMLMSPRRQLIWECFWVFALLPVGLGVLKPHSWIYPILWISGVRVWWVLRRDHDYSFRADWNIAGLDRAAIGDIMKRFVPCALVLLLFTWLAIPDHLFNLPLKRPLVWVMVMLLYPLLSVPPQELIFRSFFLTRYATLFTPARLRMASALAFGWAHLVLLNWVAVIFSAIGGYLFAHTYEKTRSLASACFEHALYGCYLFTLGLGFYFYHGQAVR